MSDDSEREFRQLVIQHVGRQRRTNSIHLSWLVGLTVGLLTHLILEIFA